jgi:methylenetetrahydrofolate dehydrogenase (NADP+) / methenyltetrahydrofolate cyclohydrolase
MLTACIASHVAEGNSVPTLVIVQVGDNPRSNVYIRQKEKFADAIGAHIRVQQYDATITVEKLTRELTTLSTDVSVHGIIIQLPLPTHIGKAELDTLIDAIDPLKDADGLTSTRAGYLFQGRAHALLPATTRGIYHLLTAYNVAIEGKHIVVIGRSNLVGKPTALYALTQGATVTICHSKTTGLKDIVRSADIVISATGNPHLITADMVHPEQVLIDVGIHISPTGVMQGDIDADEVAKVLEKGVTGGMSPVPGGVGPLTVASLFENLLDLYEVQIHPATQIHPVV